MKENKEKIKFESVVLYEKEIKESEGELKGKLKLDRKSEELEFEEGSSVMVKKVKIEDKE